MHEYPRRVQFRLSRCGAPMHVRISSQQQQLLDDAPYPEARSIIAARTPHPAFLIRQLVCVLHTSAKAPRLRIGQRPPPTTTPYATAGYPSRHGMSYNKALFASHMRSQAHNHGRAPCFYAPEDAQGDTTPPGPTPPTSPARQQLPKKGMTPRHARNGNASLLHVLIASPHTYEA